MAQKVKESPIKHTAGAEIPDTSPAAEIGRRIGADTSLLSDPMVRRGAFAVLGALAGLAAGIGLYFYFGRQGLKSGPHKEESKQAS